MKKIFVYGIVLLNIIGFSGCSSTGSGLKLNQTTNNKIDVTDFRAKALYVNFEIRDDTLIITHVSEEKPNQSYQKNVISSNKAHNDGDKTKNLKDCVALQHQGYSSCFTLGRDYNVDTSLFVKKDIGVFDIVNKVMMSPIVVAVDSLETIVLVPTGNVLHESKTKKLIMSGAEEIDQNTLNKFGSYIENKLADSNEIAQLALEGKVSLYLIDHNSQLKENLISLYRDKNTFDAYLKAFIYSKEKQDIESAYRLAKTDQDKRVAEKGLIDGLGYQRVFDITLDGSSFSDSKTTNMNLFHLSGGSVSTQDIIKDFKLSSKFALKYGTYKLKVKYTLKKKVEWYQRMLQSRTMKDENEDYIVEYNLNSNNKYSEDKKVVFKEAITSGKVGMLGVEMYTFEVKDVFISYEIISVEQV